MSRMGNHPVAGRGLATVGGEGPAKTRVNADMARDKGSEDRVDGDTLSAATGARGVGAGAQANDLPVADRR